MTGEELYEEIKEALRYFGLNFGEMSKITVIIGDHTITFRHGNKTIIIQGDKPDG